MNKRDLKFILQEGEGFHIEFKEGINSIEKSMVAFANSGGGRIFVGIDDAKKIKGIKFTNKLKAQISDIAKNCDPPVDINLRHFDNIAIVEVSASDNKPHKCSSGYYLRKDAVSQKMKRDELIDFIYDQGRKKFDSLPCHKIKQKDLDQACLKEYLEKAGIDIKVPLKEMLFNLGVYENGQVNNAGVLFFSKFPKKYFINAYITCARYLGMDKVEVLDRADFEGNVIYQVEESIKFIKRNIRLSYEIGDVRRKEIPEYPIKALREAVINAVMHRDYFETGTNVGVDIFDDRIVIANTGSLIRPLTKDKLGKISVRRNPLIADLFHRIKYVEKMGTGLARIKSECRQRNIKVKIETNGVFIISFKKTKERVPVNVPVNVSVNVPVNNRQKWLLGYLVKYKKITISELQEKFTKVSLKTLKRDLAYLRKNKAIKFVGSPKTGYYMLIDKGSCNKHK
jgi:ATP-dependent DNA helicase RecG